MPRLLKSPRKMFFQWKIHSKTFNFDCFVQLVSCQISRCFTPWRERIRFTVGGFFSRIQISRSLFVIFVHFWAFLGEISTQTPEIAWIFPLEQMSGKCHLSKEIPSSVEKSLDTVNRKLFCQVRWPRFMPSQNTPRFYCLGG